MWYIAWVDEGLPSIHRTPDFWVMGSGSWLLSNGFWIISRYASSGLGVNFELFCSRIDPIRELSDFWVMGSGSFVDTHLRIDPIRELSDFWEMGSESFVDTHLRVLGWSWGKIRVVLFTNWPHTRALGLLSNGFWIIFRYASSGPGDTTNDTNYRFCSNFEQRPRFIGNRSSWSATHCHTSRRYFRHAYMLKTPDFELSEG